MLATGRGSEVLRHLTPVPGMAWIVASGTSEAPAATKVPRCPPKPDFRSGQVAGFLPPRLVRTGYSEKQTAGHRLVDEVGKLQRQGPHGPQADGTRWDSYCKDTQIGTSSPSSPKPATLRVQKLVVRLLASGGRTSPRLGNPFQIFSQLQLDQGGSGVFQEDLRNMA